MTGKRRTVGLLVKTDKQRITHDALHFRLSKSPRFSDFFSESSNQNAGFLNGPIRTPGFWGGRLLIHYYSSLFSGAREQVVQTMVRLLYLSHIADSLILDVLLYGKQL